MQTQDKQPIIEQARPPGRPRRRWLVPAVAGAVAVVIAIVVAATLLSGDDEPDVTNDPVPTQTTVPVEVFLTPLEVGEILNQAAITGDWEAQRALFADEATLTDTFLVEGLDPNPPNLAVDAALSQPAAFFFRFPISSEFDWDGDGTVTLFDSVASEVMAHYASGVTTRFDCAESGPGSIECEMLLEGDPFLIDSCDEGALDGRLVGFVRTYTVTDGLIVNQSIDTAPCVPHADSSRREYHDWVRANHAEVNADDALFETWGKPLITSDTVDTHRQLIAEWRVQS